VSAVAIWRLVKIALGVGFIYAFTRQCRKPAGPLGRRVARAMNLSHGALTAWGLGGVRIEPQARILDVGCGGGQTIRVLAGLAAGVHVDGVDYSPASVRVARTTNVDLIEQGRVAVQQASVSSLPFPDRSFDLVTAVETHYYWPGLADDLGEVRRVLKPGGRFVLIAETYRGRRMDWLYRPVMRLLLQATYLTPDQHAAALNTAGFAGVAVNVDQGRGWIRAMGVGPSL
jgi:SAM-dependent methyltransferase